MNETTLDGLLGRRVAFEQPAQGYRVAIDTVMLAAAVHAQAGNRILDMGCGAGGAMLCLAARVAGVTGVGVDIQPGLIELCRRNIARNVFAAGLEAAQGDGTALPPDFSGAFDHVMMNPPFHDNARHDASPNAIRQTANTDRPGDLALWIASAAAALKPSGVLTMIHRADRRNEILSGLQLFFGDIDILPLAPKANAEPKRIILRARKGAVFSARSCRPLILHKPDGGFTDDAEAILRHCQSLEFAACPGT